MRKISALTLLASLALLSAPCRRNAAPVKDGDRLRVFVSILPQAYFVQRVGGEHVDVEVLVGPGQGPHNYEPTLKQMTRLAGARLYFRIGVPFEETLVRKLASFHQDLRIVDTRRGIELHPAEDDHEGRKDPHIWLSPKLASIQAGTICDALCEADPVNKADYRSNLARLQRDLAGLDARIAKALAPLRGRTFYVFHPAFGYFAEAYGLKQEAVEIGGRSPSARHIKELIEKARAEGVKVIFVQPQFSGTAAETIAAAIGGAVVRMDPLAPDYFRNLEEMTEKIQNALGPRPP